MSKHRHAFMGAFLLVITLHFSQANSETNSFDVAKSIMSNLNTMCRIRHCLTRSCNPLAVQKAFAIDDLSEMKLKQKPYDSESDIDRVLKLNAVLAESVPQCRKIDLECKDHLYTCPNRNRSKTSVPSEYYEYCDLVEMMVSASEYIKKENIPQAIRVLGSAVAYIESNTDTVGTSTSRFLPAFELAAKGFKEMGNPPKETESTDKISEDNVSGKGLAMDLGSSLLKDESLAKIINKVLLLVPSKEASKKPFWVWLKKA